MREEGRKQFGELWGRQQSITFPLDLKAQLGFGDQRSETRPVGGPVLGAWGEVAGKLTGARSGLFSLRFVFFPKQGRPATGILLSAPLLLPS